MLMKEIRIKEKPLEGIEPPTPSFFEIYKTCALTVELQRLNNAKKWCVKNVLFI